jgi:hypothetical protein
MMQENAKNAGVHKHNLNVLESGILSSEDYSKKVKETLGNEKVDIVFYSSPGLEVPQNHLWIPPGFRQAGSRALDLQIFLKLIQPILDPNSIVISVGWWEHTDTSDAFIKKKHRLPRSAEEQEHQADSTWLSARQIYSQPILTKDYYKAVFGPQSQIPNAKNEFLHRLLITTGHGSKQYLDNIAKRDINERVERDHQIVSMTTTPLTISTENFFLEPIGDHSVWKPSKSNETISESSRPEEHQLAEFLAYIQRYGLPHNDTFSAIIIDTAPFHRVATLSGIPIHQAVWFPKNGKKETAVNIIRDYLTCVNANTNSDIFLFKHPDRFARPFEWNRVHSSTIGSQYQIPADFPKKMQPLFMNYVSKHKNESKKINEEEKSNNAISDLVSNHISTVTLDGHKNVQDASDAPVLWYISTPADYAFKATVGQNDDKKEKKNPIDSDSVYAAVNNDINKLKEEYSGKEKELNELHLSVWEFVNHVRVRETLSNSLSISTSRLVSFPISFVPQPKPKDEYEMEEANSQTFRGVLWVWFFAPEYWGRAQELAAQRIVRLLSHLYSDSFHRWATSELIVHDKQLLTSALSHETKNMISMLLTGLWSRPLNSFAGSQIRPHGFHESNTEAKMSDEVFSVASNHHSKSSSQNHDLTEAILIPFPKYFQACLRTLRCWFPTDLPEMLPFMHGKQKKPKTLANLLELCFESIMDTAVAFGISNAFASVNTLDYSFRILAWSDRIRNAIKIAPIENSELKFPMLDWGEEHYRSKTMAIARLTLTTLREDIQHCKSPLFPPKITIKPAPNFENTGQFNIVNTNYLPTTEEKNEKINCFLNKLLGKNKTDQEVRELKDAIQLLQSGAAMMRMRENGVASDNKNKYGQKIIKMLLDKIDPNYDITPSNPEECILSNQNEFPVKRFEQTYTFRPYKEIMK